MTRAIVAAAVVGGLLASTALAAEGPAFPPGADAREARLLGRLPPAATQCAVRQGRAHVGGAFGEGEARAAVSGCPGGGADIEALVLIALMESGKAAEEELRNQLEQLQAANKAKAEQRQAHAQLQAERQRLAGQKDSLSELSQMQSMRLQMYAERRRKLYETLSNMMKKAGDTDAAIVGNLK